MVVIMMMMMLFSKELGSGLCNKRNHAPSL